MKIISLNIAVLRTIPWRGHQVSTGIYKEAVSSRVIVGTLGIEGDVQVDRRYHGGPDKAVYAYAAEHYPAWKKELRRDDIPFGMFGENLTIEGGLFEDTIFVGDRFLAGSCELVAIQPRLPCYKLGVRFGTQRMVKQFGRSGRFGVYFRVTREGAIAAGDTMERIERNPSDLSIRDVGMLILGDHGNTEMLAQAAMNEFLPDNFRSHFRAVLQKEH